MNELRYLIIVNTETPAGEDVQIDELIRRDTDPEHLGGRGLNRPRMNDVITLSGELLTLVPEENNSEVDLWGISLGKDGLLGSAKYVGFVGGKTKDGQKDWDTRTDKQKEALKTYVKYHQLKHQGIQVMGLDEVPALKGEEMPGFNVAKWLESIKEE